MPVSVLKLRGAAQIAIGDYPRALDTFEKALLVAPDDDDHMCQDISSRKSNYQLVIQAAPFGGHCIRHFIAGRVTVRQQCAFISLQHSPLP